MKLKLHSASVMLPKSKYNKLLSNIGTAIATGKSNALSALNQQLLNTYWEIGKHIVEFEQEGNLRAEYGTTGGLSNKIFVSKYQLYLPDKKMIEEKIKEIVEAR